MYIIYNIEYINLF